MKGMPIYYLAYLDLVLNGKIPKKRKANQKFRVIVSSLVLSFWLMWHGICFKCWILRITTI